MSNFGWNYPPGVTGNEPELVGPPNCKACWHDYEEHDEAGCNFMVTDTQRCICPEYLEFGGPEKDDYEDEDDYEDDYEGRD
jgi:hypothetical protein